MGEGWKLVMGLVALAVNCVVARSSERVLRLGGPCVNGEVGRYCVRAAKGLLEPVGMGFRVSAGCEVAQGLLLPAEG